MKIMPAAVIRAPSDVCGCAAAQPSQRPVCSDPLNAGGVTVRRRRLAANDLPIRLKKDALAILESAPFEAKWRDSGEKAAHRMLLLPNSAQIAPAGRELDLRWTAEPVFLEIAFASKLLHGLRQEMGVKGADFEPHFGVRDRDIDGLAAKFRLELHFGGASGPHFLQSLGVLLAVHLIRRYTQAPPQRSVAGGLDRVRLRRIVNHIEVNLCEDIGLAALAEIAGLSAHHFAGAFRLAAGVSPHRYIMERRIARSLERLLSEPETTITALAHSLGFSSHGHFTTTFQRFIGTSPSKFRVKSD
ncbi:helix-turn-helix transcriptional regulator [Hyphococcus sp.]|uniref:helix-turn-helix transcriptional regulator n=2 Tax=Hyphococcus sp. TaxID=2038636 RepID=UPI0035C6EDA5